MTEHNVHDEEPQSIAKATNFFANGFYEFTQQFRMVWRLLLDGRVPVLTKLIPLLAALYVISPVDLVPDLVLGFGQLDDLVVFLLGLRLFIDVCPPDLVQEFEAGETNPVSAPPNPQGIIIDVEARVPGDDDNVQEVHFK